jgi:hypothetical protein
MRRMTAATAVPSPARPYATMSGLTAAVLFAVGSAIWALEMPEDGTAVAQVVGFYDDTADRIVVGGSLSLLAIALFVAFAAEVRHVLIEAGEHDFLATTAFGGGMLVVVAGMSAETINMAAALRARDDELTDPLAQALFEISQILGSVATGVGTGVFAVAVGAAALRTRGVLPRPVALSVLVLGVVCLTPLAHLNWLPSAALVAVAVLIALGLRRA